jgi:hypothetical protein
MLIITIDSVSVELAGLSCLLPWLFGRELTVGGLRFSNEESIVGEVVLDVGRTRKLDGYTKPKTDNKAHTEKSKKNPVLKTKTTQQKLCSNPRTRPLFTGSTTRLTSRL